MINILVLGVGGNVSQGIIKVIRNLNLECKIIGACISPDSLGLYFCDKAYISPLADNKDFIPWLINICKKENIDIIFTGVEEIIIKIAEEKDNLFAHVPSIFVASSLEKLKIGQDKLLTCRWLKENSCNYPEFLNENTLDNLKLLIHKVGFPLIAKPRKGKGSQGIKIINNFEDAISILELEDYIIQKYVGQDDEEYTVGCYSDKNGNYIDSIIMRRKLHNGTTVKAEIVENQIIKEEVIKICNKFNPVGPLNIQLRMENNIPICFEMNVRFSGTTPMRTYFGFNDVLAMINEYVLNKEIKNLFEYRKGVAYRYMNEVYIEEAASKIMLNNRIIENMNNFEISIEKLGE